MPLGAFKAALMGTAGVSTGDVVLLSSQTADGSDELDFNGITSTYGEYIFRFYNIFVLDSRIEIKHLGLRIQPLSNFGIQNHSEGHLKIASRPPGRQPGSSIVFIL